MARFHRILPCLWFDKEAEEAANFYVSIFPNSRIVQTTRFGEAGHELHGQPAGSVLTVLFELDGHQLTALNGGPQFKFSEAISLQIMCETQEEIDYYWGRLTEGGKAGSCGWLTDRYGLSWQVNPTLLPEMLTDPNPERVERVFQAVYRMKKMEIAALRAAYAGE